MIGAPDTVPSYPARRALNCAARGHKRRLQRPGVIVRWENHTVTLVAHNRAYGASTHGRATYTHVVRAVYVAWRRGRFVDSLVLWMCGGRSNNFELLDEPSRPLCPICEFWAKRGVNAGLESL